MEMAIEVQSLSKRYSGFELQNVSFALPYGAVMGFIGANGAGKTTTIKAILGLINTDGGEIRLLGEPAGKKDIRSRLGVVLDDCSAYDQLSLAQVGKVESALRAGWEETLWQSYIRRFELPFAKLVKDYSRGMKMKLFIALALSHRPQLLILDEPTGGLDPLMREEVLDIFREFMQEENHAILLSSHITGDLDKIADYVTFIHEGRIVFSRDKESLLDEWTAARYGKAANASIEEIMLSYVQEERRGGK